MGIKKPIRKIWVQAKPHSDPVLKGMAQVRKLWAINRMFTEKPEEVTVTHGVIRMLKNGDIIEVKTPMIKSQAVTPLKKHKEQ